MSRGRTTRIAHLLLTALWLGFGGRNVFSQTSAAAHEHHAYYVDCASAAANTSAAPAGNESHQSPLHSIAEANAIMLVPGDRVLFKRGSICAGGLRPQGSGTDAEPIEIGSYGEGPRPRIEALPEDEAAMRLFNQNFYEIHSLDLKGGRLYGFFAGGDRDAPRHLHLRDLRVHDVRGPMKQKEAGLVVIQAREPAIYNDVDVDGVLASDTTQWSGIFVSGASHVRVRNSMVHDVQGDGIVVFSSRDAVISRSAAWHTGMEHQQSIGTPNAIWTWHCTDCAVEDNEAFLTDSPGVDGGSFDIDYGNTRNTVQRNFGHDTAGYCISIFGAFGPTIDSVVADNLCLNNGMSPRLAQRQGAILLMTWQGGSLRGVEVRGNRIDWQPPGDTPAIQSGATLNATEIMLRSNEIQSTGISFVDPELQYSGTQNRYVVMRGDAADLAAAQQRFGALPEKDSSLSAPPVGAGRGGLFGHAPREASWDRSASAHPWKLMATIPESMLTETGDDGLRGLLVELKSAALQFSYTGLEVSMVASEGFAAIARDWLLAEGGVKLDLPRANVAAGLSIKLVSSDGQIVREWRSYPGPVDLGLALRQSLGRPNFSHLELENVRATE